MTEEAQIQAIADKFRANIRAALSGGELIKIDALNATPEYEGCCASHDLCDANEYMAPAFEAIMGREIDLQSIEESTIWGNAWEIAKNKGFAWSLLELWLEKGGTAETLDEALRLCISNAEVDSDPYAVLVDHFHIKDPRYSLDMQKLVKGVRS